MLNRTLPYEAKQKSIFDLAKQLSPGIADMVIIQIKLGFRYPYF